MTYKYVVDNATGHIRARGTGALVVTDEETETLITSSTLFSPAAFVYDFGLESFQLRSEGEVATEDGERAAAEAAIAEAVTTAIDGLLLLPAATQAIFRALITLPQPLLRSELESRDV